MVGTYTHTRNQSHVRLVCKTPSEVGIGTGAGRYWGRNCPHHAQDLMLLGSSEVGMIPLCTTAKTSRDHVMILTEEPCLCTSSTLTKFQVMVTAGFGCGTPMLVSALLGSAILGSASLAEVGHTGVGLTGVPPPSSCWGLAPPFFVNNNSEPGADATQTPCPHHHAPAAPLRYSEAYKAPFDGCPLH